MGYAQGSLLKTQIQEIIPGFYAHVETEVEQYIQDLPKGTEESTAIDQTQNLILNYSLCYV